MAILSLTSLKSRASLDACLEYGKSQLSSFFTASSELVLKILRGKHAVRLYMQLLKDSYSSNGYVKPISNGKMPYGPSNLQTCIPPSSPIQ